MLTQRVTVHRCYRYSDTLHDKRNEIAIDEVSESSSKAIDNSAPSDTCDY